MARYVQHVVLDKPNLYVVFIMNDFLDKNDFVMSDWKGESAYRSGDNILTRYRFLKYSYVNGVFHLEAWVKGTFGGEWDLDGFGDALYKGLYKSSLQTLITTLQQPIPQQMVASFGTLTFSQPSYTQPDNTSETGTQNTGSPVSPTIPVQAGDNPKAAILSLVLGILSIVFCFIPLLGLILGTLGLSQVIKGWESSKANLAKAGKICCLVGMSLVVCIYLFRFLFSIPDLISLLF